MVAKVDSESWTRKISEEVQVQIEPSEPPMHPRLKEQTGSSEVMVQTGITEQDATCVRRENGTAKDKSSGGGFCGFVRRLLKMKSDKRKERKHLSLQELHEAELMLKHSSSLVMNQGVQWQGTPFCAQSFVFPLNDRGIWGPPELPPHPQRVPAELHWLLGTLPRRREYELCAPGGSFFPPPADDVLRLGGGERAEPAPDGTQFDDDLEERFGWFYDRPPPSAFRRQGWPSQPSAPQMPPYEPYLHYCLGNLPPRSADSEFDVIGAGEGEGGHGGGRVHPSAGTTHMRTVPAAAGSPSPGRSTGGSSAGAAHPLSSVSAHATRARSREEKRQQPPPPSSAQPSRASPRTRRRCDTRSALRRRSGRIGSAARRRSSANANAARRHRRGATVAPGVKVAPGPIATASEAVSPDDDPRVASSASASGGNGRRRAGPGVEAEAVVVEDMVAPNAMPAAPTSTSQVWLSVRRSLEARSPRVTGQRPASHRRRRPSAPMTTAPGPRGLGALGAVLQTRSPVRDRRKEELTAAIVPRVATSQTDSKEKLSPQSWDSVVTIRYPHRHRITGSNRRRVVGQMGSQRDLECLVELSSEEVPSSTCQPSSTGKGLSHLKRRKDVQQFPRSSAPMTLVQIDAQIETRPQNEQGTETSVSRPRSACGDYKQ